MKRIELDQYQKTRFQTMVMKLFPEYKYFEWHQSNTFWLYNRKGLNSDLVWFHWFEFANTILLDKISEIYDDFVYNEAKNREVNYLDGTIATYLQLTLIQGDHPIDFLYKQFEKLNLK